MLRFVNLTNVLLQNKKKKRLLDSILCLAAQIFTYVPLSVKCWSYFTMVESLGTQYSPVPPAIVTLPSDSSLGINTTVFVVNCVSVTFTQSHFSDVRPLSSISREEHTPQFNKYCDVSDVALNHGKVLGRHWRIAHVITWDKQIAACGGKVYRDVAYANVSSSERKHAT